MRSLIIITDATAYGDDSIAIALLASARSVEIRAIVATSGNVWAEDAAENVESLLHRLDRRDIPVSIGMSGADFQRQRIAFSRNADDRAAPYRGALDLAARSRPVSATGDLPGLLSHAGARTDIVLFGPATVLAVAISANPALSERIGRIFAMGGTIGRVGNATASAEFNFWFDPEAAEAILASRIPLTLLPLDPVAGIVYKREFARDIVSTCAAAEHLSQCLGRREAQPACDEILAAVYLDAGLIYSRLSLKLGVVTTPGTGYGRTIVLSDAAERRPVDVVETVDLKRFWRSLISQFGIRHQD